MYPTLRQTFVLILHTKFSWHSSSDFVYKIFCIENLAGIVLLILYTKNLSKCRIHFVYISCIYLVQFLYTKCIYTVSVWDGDSSKILILI